SGPAARRWALALREEHDAILVGSGTVLADDPRLDRRGVRTDRLSAAPILRVVLDRRLRTPESAKLFSIAGPVRIYTESEDAAATANLGARGATVVHLPRVTPETVLAELGTQGVSSVLVEGGREVATSFFDARLFDRLEIAAAARLIGGVHAPGPVGGPGVTALAEAPSIEGLKARKCGSDLVLSGFSSKCLRELFASLEL
ncbi:MAG: dihydrofolate reductase family protein, partial [Thermoanaerobaculia bacterium]